MAAGNFVDIPKVEAMSIEEAFTFMAYERDIHLQQNMQIDEHS